MLRLILKILVVYWIVDFAVFFVLPRQIHHGELIDALNSSLAFNGRFIADKYEGGRCPTIQNAVATSVDMLFVATPDGRFLCGAPSVSGIGKLVMAAAHSGKRAAVNYTLFQLIAYPVMSSSGKSYVVLLKTNFSSNLERYGILPGYPAIGISFAVSVVLSIFAVFPIRKLRTAARSIAMGKLETRVTWGPIPELVFGKHSHDDVARLVCDFNHMAERLQSLTAAQRVLLRDVSHELRSPLTRLEMGLGLARREPVDQRMRGHLDRIKTEAKRLNELIGQILSLSYLETIQEIQPSADISLNDLLRTLLPAIEYEAEQHGCFITTNIESGCFVKGDGELLRSAVENILRNAIRYVPYTGLIHVETILAEYEGKRLSVIRISDNGPGIPEAELATVLEPFNRGRSSNPWDQGGFGIGLAIAHRAASVHGGSIKLANLPEGGLRVEMCLPSSI